MITILNASKKPLAIIEDYFDDEISEQINGAYTLKFSVYLYEDKSQSKLGISPKSKCNYLTSSITGAQGRTLEQ